MQMASCSVKEEPFMSSEMRMAERFRKARARTAAVAAMTRQAARRESYQDYKQPAPLSKRCRSHSAKGMSIGPRSKRTATTTTTTTTTETSSNQAMFAVTGSMKALSDAAHIAAAITTNDDDENSNTRAADIGFRTTALFPRAKRSSLVADREELLQRRREVLASRLDHHRVVPRQEQNLSTRPEQNGSGSNTQQMNTMTTMIYPDNRLFPPTLNHGAVNTAEIDAPSNLIPSVYCSDLTRSNHHPVPRIQVGVQQEGPTTATESLNLNLTNIGPSFVIPQQHQQPQHVMLSTSTTGIQQFPSVLLHCWGAAATDLTHPTGGFQQQKPSGLFQTDDAAFAPSKRVVAHQVGAEQERSRKTAPGSLNLTSTDIAPSFVIPQQQHPSVLLHWGAADLRHQGVGVQLEPGFLQKDRALLAPAMQEVVNGPHEARLRLPLSQQQHVVKPRCFMDHPSPSVSTRTRRPTLSSTTDTNSRGAALLFPHPQQLEQQQQLTPQQQQLLVQLNPSQLSLVSSVIQRMGRLPPELAAWMSTPSAPAIMMPHQNNVVMMASSVPPSNCPVASRSSSAGPASMPVSESSSSSSTSSTSSSSLSRTDDGSSNNGTAKTTATNVAKTRVPSLSSSSSSHPEGPFTAPGSLLKSTEIAPSVVVPQQQEQQQQQHVMVSTSGTQQFPSVLLHWGAANLPHQAGGFQQKQRFLQTNDNAFAPSKRVVVRGRGPPGGGSTSLLAPKDISQQQQQVVKPRCLMDHPSPVSTAEPTLVSDDNTNKNRSPETKTKKRVSSYSLLHHHGGGGRTIPMSVESDPHMLSKFHNLLREQILFFEAGPSDLQIPAKGQTRPIRLGQVGIVCFHCQIRNMRHSMGAVYFPQKLNLIYQAAQIMVANHYFGEHTGTCPNIPQEILENLQMYKSLKWSLYGGAPQYWAQQAVEVGVLETEDDGLVFASKNKEG